AAIAPDGKRLYVAGTDDNTISIIDTVKNRRTDMIEIGRRPIGIAVSPDSKTIYVLNSDDNAVAVLAADTLSITKTISVGNKPEAMALSPNGRSLFVANFRDNKVTAIVDIDKPDEVRSLPSGGAMPVNLAVSPDGKMLLVANRFRAGQDKEGLIRQFDLENDFQSSDIVTPLPLGKMVFTLDNQTFFVSSDPKDSTDGPSQLWLCKPNRAESKGTVQPIPDAYGGGLSFAPDGKHLYIGDEGALTKLSLPKPPPSVAAAVYAQSSQYHGWAGYYLFSGTNYTQYRWENGRFATWPSYPQPNSTWNGAFTSMDAAFYAAESVYLFSGTQFVRYGDPGGTQAIEQPQQVDETTWPGLPFQSLTAAFAISLNQIYLFSDEAYCIYDLENKRMVQAAEAVTVKSWPDLPFQRIDAAFINDQKEVTFFSGVQYCVYNLVQKRMVSDWPLPINDYSWPSLPYPSVPKISELVYGVDPNVGAPMLSWSVTLATDISFSAPMVQRMIAYQNQGQIPPEGRSPIQLVPGSKITLIAENAFGSTEKTITIS
ncbi:MAG: beta-propeller fold lactonase family protein, partial [Chloroflexota bacterium]